MEERVRLSTRDGFMPAYVGRPEGTLRGAVVVVQEAFGLTAHIRDVCRRVGHAGFVAIAPALFHREGSPVFDYGDFEAIGPALKTLTETGITEDLQATYEWLEHEGFGDARTGIIGFCMGGTVAFRAATRHRLGAAVTFYGGGIAEGRFGFPPLLELAPSLRTPWLGLYGDRDQGIPVEQVEQLRTAVQRAPVETEIVRYADAGHGFNNDDRPDVFDAHAAGDAWARAMLWFETHLAGA